MRIRTAVQPAVALALSLSMCAVASPAMATAPSISSAAIASQSNSVSLGDQPTKSQLTEAFKAASEGEIIYSSTTRGYRVTITKSQGRPSVNVVPLSGSKQPNNVQMDALGFCHAAAMAAVLAIGAAGFAFLAASGGGIVFGVMLSARVAGQFAALLAGGSGVEALVAQFIC